MNTAFNVICSTAATIECQPIFVLSNFKIQGDIWWIRVISIANMFENVLCYFPGLVVEQQLSSSCILQWAISLDDCSNTAEQYLRWWNIATDSGEIPLRF
jgi:hypothetical protein